MRGIFQLITGSRTDRPLAERGLKKSLLKAAADFPVDGLRNSIDEWPQRLQDGVRAIGGHFE